MGPRAIAILMLSHNDETIYPIIWSYENNCFKLWLLTFLTVQGRVLKD